MLIDADRHDHDLLVQRVVVSDDGAQRQRGRLVARVEEDRGTRHPHDRRLDARQLVEEVAQRPLLLGPVAGYDLAPAAPGDHHGRDHQTDRQRQVGAVGDLRQVGGEERDLDGQEQRAETRQLPLRGPPQGARDCDEQDRVEDERPRDGDPVDVTQAVGALEHEHQRRDADAKEPVDQRHVDLTLEVRGVDDPQPWQEAELHRLLGDAERAGQRRLGGDDRRHRGEQDHRHQEAARHDLEERVEVRLEDRGGVGLDPSPPDRGRRASLPGTRSRTRSSVSDPSRSARDRHTAPRRRCSRARRRRASATHRRRGRS